MPELSSNTSDDIGSDIGSDINKINIGNFNFLNADSSDSCSNSIQINNKQSIINKRPLPIPETPIENNSPIIGNTQTQPMQRPMQTQPMQRPMQTQPMQGPMQTQPMQRPMQGQPMQRPMQTQPMQKQVQTQPMQRPMQTQPMQKQVQTQPMQGQRPVQTQPMQKQVQTQPMQKQVQTQSPVLVQNHFDISNQLFEPHPDSRNVSFNNIVDERLITPIDNLNDTQVDNQLNQLNQINQLNQLNNTDSIKKIKIGKLFVPKSTAIFTVVIIIIGVVLFFGTKPTTKKLKNKKHEHKEE